MRALALALLLPLAACGGNDDRTTTTAPTTAGTASEAGTATDGTEARVENGTVTIRPRGEEMRYAETSFTATAGSQIRLVFQNTASGAAMQHNVVILQPGTDANSFGMAAASASDNDYVPADRMNEVVAYTPMAAPGETVEVSFTVPTEPGEYVYICTFPGHYMSMRGVMRVVAS